MANKPYPMGTAIADAGNPRTGGEREPVRAHGPNHPEELGKLVTRNIPGQTAVYHALAGAQRNDGIEALSEHLIHPGRASGYSARSQGMGMFVSSTPGNDCIDARARNQRSQNHDSFEDA